MRWPENTLLAYENALKSGVDRLELDVQPTRDEVLVVAHDDTVDRCTDGYGTVRDFRLSEIKQLDAAAHHDNFRNQGIAISAPDVRSGVSGIHEGINCEVAPGWYTRVDG